MRRSVLSVVLAVAALSVVACGDDDGEAAPGPSTTTTALAPTTTAAPETTMAAETTTTLPATPRDALVQRLAAELDDPALAADVVAGIDDATIGTIEQAAGGDIAASPLLSYSPPTVAGADVDSLWVFSYGYRFTAEAVAQGLDSSGAVPPLDALEPGPVNEALAEAAAAFVAEHPVLIVAQWEVARILADMGVPDVISVEPDIAADGTVTYLSTAGVAEKGLSLAADAGVTVGRAGILCFADHAVRCVLTAGAAGIDAAVPEGVELPAEYDPESGQPWTRSRAAWVPVDLLGRALLG